ncbi:adenylate kinase isoenzyme 5-like [Odontesthes bonariensis]
MAENSGLRQELSVLPLLRPRPLVIFILGGPGSGKGRQTARLSHLFGLRSVSLDELLRRRILSSSCRKWEIISQMMSHREPGPQEDVVPELRQQLIGQPGVVGFIVDGFPRDVHQALSFQEQCEAKYRPIREECEAKYRPIREECEAKYRPIREQCEAKYRPIREECEAKYRPIREQCEAKKDA